jgi:hypothetical protein
MSATTCEPLQEQKIYTTYGPSADAATTTRKLFASQTGQTLVALGTLFKHIPPFNETIDKSTGDMLISIGRRLKSAK